MNEVKRKKLFKELKADLVLGWGRKCKEFHVGCIACQLHRGLDTVEFYVKDGLPPRKNHKKSYVKTTKPVLT